MTNDKRNAYVVRDSVLKLLSDEEVARVTTAETAERLTTGDEYLDLDHLDRGVLKALDAATKMGSTLPRKSVHEDTWRKIMTRLEEARTAPPPSHT